MTDSLRAAFQAITWRNVLLLQALGQLAIYLESRESNLVGSWMGHPSVHYVAMALSVFLAVPIALLSDEAVQRGVPARVAYPLAVASTVPVAFLSTVATQSLYIAVLGVRAGTPNLFWLNNIYNSFDMSVYGAFAMVIFMNQRTADRILEKFRNSELRRVQLEQQLVESRLATAEAQIDPTMLFNQLADIKRGFSHGEEHAEQQLNDLIQILRAALGRTVTANDPEAKSPS